MYGSDCTLESACLNKNCTQRERRCYLQCHSRTINVTFAQSFVLMAAVAIGVSGLPMQTFNTSQYLIQRMRTCHPVNKNCKVPLVFNLKPAECRRNRRAKMKPNGKRHAFPLQYFHLMLPNLNSLKALYVLLLEN